MRSIVLLFLCFLTACTTLKPTSPADASAPQTAAAKINIQLGMAYLQQKSVERSKQKFLLALHDAPNLPEAWYAMGYFLESTGDKEKANTYYLTALQLAPKRGDTLNNYGTYLCRNNNYKQSVNYFLQAAADPEYLDSAASYENAGLCAARIPDKNLAVAYFNKALAADPNRATSLLKLAELNYQLGHHALARRELSRFLEISPPTAQSYLLEQKLDG